MLRKCVAHLGDPYQECCLPVGHTGPHAEMPFQARTGWVSVVWFSDDTAELGTIKDGKTDFTVSRGMIILD